MRSLTIFYSETGNTYQVANTIHKLIGSHTKEIIDNNVHRSLHEYFFTTICNSARIEPKSIDIDYYETIFIGSPVWMGTISPAIVQFIENMDFKNKDIIIFVTGHGVCDDLALKRMSRIIKKHNGNVISGFIIHTNGDSEQLKRDTTKAMEDLHLL